MFNKHFNLQDYIFDLPPVIRSHVLLSLVGTINNALVSGADQVARFMADEGITVDGSAAEVEAQKNGLETSPAFGDFFHEMRQLSALGDVLRTESHRLQNREAKPGELPFGSIERAIADACGVQRLRKPSDEGIAALKSLGIEPTKEMLEASAKSRQQRDQAFADKRAERRGLIEWVIDHLFDAFVARGDGDYWEPLPVERKEALVGKLVNALEAGIKRATENTLYGNSGELDLGVGDIPLLRDYKAQVIQTAYPPSEATKREAQRAASAPPTEEPKAPKTKGKRATAKA